MIFPLDWTSSFSPMTILRTGQAALLGNLFTRIDWLRLQREGQIPGETGRDRHNVCSVTGIPQDSLGVRLYPTAVSAGLAGSVCSTMGYRSVCVCECLYRHSPYDLSCSGGGVVREGGGWGNSPFHPGALWHPLQAMHTHCYASLWMTSFCHLRLCLLHLKSHHHSLWAINPMQ